MRRAKPSSLSIIAQVKILFKVEFQQRLVLLPSIFQEASFWRCSYKDNKYKIVQVIMYLKPYEQIK